MYTFTFLFFNVINEIPPYNEKEFHNSK